jgi:branched-subunit amino acid transport protein
MSDGGIDNPFASPQVSAVTVDPAAADLLPMRPWAMLFVGIVVGAIIGATAGGVTSGAMGFVGIAMQDDVNDPFSDFGDTTVSPWAALVIGGILGGFQGTWIGGVVGGIVGLVCGTSTPLRMGLPMWLGGILSAIGGGFFGAVAANIVLIGGGPDWQYRWSAIAIGGLLGIGAGLVAGAFLGRVLYGMAVRWRGVGTPRPVFPLGDGGPEFVTPHPLDLR